MRVDICANKESDDVEERHPSMFGEEFLRECERNRGDDPADFHDWHKAGLDGSLYLVEGSCTCDNGHGDKVDGVLDGRDLDAHVNCGTLSA